MQLRVNCGFEFARFVVAAFVEDGLEMGETNNDFVLRGALFGAVSEVLQKL